MHTCANGNSTIAIAQHASSLLLDVRPQCKWSRLSESAEKGGFHIGDLLARDAPEAAGERQLPQLHLTAQQAPDVALRVLHRPLHVLLLWHTEATRFFSKDSCDTAKNCRSCQDQAAEGCVPSKEGTR